MYDELNRLIKERSVLEETGKGTDVPVGVRELMYLLVSDSDSRKEYCIMPVPILVEHRL
jgi:hypothetical protein